MGLPPAHTALLRSSVADPAISALTTEVCGACAGPVRCWGRAVCSGASGEMDGAAVRPPMVRGGAPHRVALRSGVALRRALCGARSAAGRCADPPGDRNAVLSGCGALRWSRNTAAVFAPSSCCAGASLSSSLSFLKARTAVALLLRLLFLANRAPPTRVLCRARVETTRRPGRCHSNSPPAL